MIRYGGGGYKGIGFSSDSLPSTNKISSTTGQCWRYAVKADQGQGWCKYTGTDWIVPDPLMDSLRFPNEDNEMVSLVLDEKTGLWFQMDCREAPTNSDIIDSYTDKRNSGAAGTEITTALKQPEHIGMNEDWRVEHNETHIRLRPRLESLRSATGYDSAGYRSSFKVDVQAYVDGVQTQTQSTEHIPINGDITFSEKVEGNRVQIGFTTDTSEFRVVSMRSDYQEKDAGTTDTKRTMSEATYQANLCQPVLWMSRWLDPDVNLATNTAFGGAYDSLVADTNGDSYAIRFNGAGDGFTDAIDDLSGDFTLMLVTSAMTASSTLYKKGVLDIHIVKAGAVYTLHYEDGANNKTQLLAHAGTGWLYLLVQRSGANLYVGEAGAFYTVQALGGGVVNYTGTDYIMQNATAYVSDFRVYDSAISENTYKWWRSDLVNNSGKGVLPQW